jgi:hypothetical protein
VTPAHVFALFFSCKYQPENVNTERKRSIFCADRPTYATDASTRRPAEPLSSAAFQALVLRILGSLGTKVGAGNGCCVLSGFSCQLGIVKSTGIAQCASSIWTSAPFGRLGSVTTVTSAWRSGALQDWIRCHSTAF